VSPEKPNTPNIPPIQIERLKGLAYLLGALVSLAAANYLSDPGDFQPFTDARDTWELLLALCGTGLLFPGLKTFKR